MAPSPPSLPESSLFAACLRRSSIALAVVLGTLLAVTPGSHGWSVACAAEAPDAAAVRRAEAIATEAKILFQQKEFAQAAERFMEAYTLARRPTLIYNAARAYQEAGNVEKALALFRAYRGLPDVNDAGRADADARISVLEKIVAERKAAEEATRLAKEKQERERQDRLAREAQERERLAREAKEREARDAALKARLKAEADKPAPGRPFPTAAAASTAGLGVAAGGLDGLALLQASSARELEARLHSDAAGKAYLAHVERATILRNVAIGAGVLAAGCASWFTWELLASPSAPAAPKTTIIRPAGAGVGPLHPDVAVTLTPQHVGLAVRF